MIRKKKLLGFSSRQYMLLVGLLMLEVVFTAWLFKTLKNREDQIHFYIFESQAKEMVASIRKEISIDLEKLTSLSALYDVSYPISKESFHEFSKHLIQSNGSIHALEWIPRINGNEKELFESSTRKMGFSSFIITEKKGDRLLPAGLRKEYFPVYFIEPIAGNETALGFDLASNPSRLKAMKKADSINQVVVTEPINLVQGNSSEKGILAFYPFKRNGVLLGYFSGVFKIDNLISKSSGSFSGNHFHLNVQDPEAAANNRVLVRNLMPGDNPAEKDSSQLNSNGVKYQEIIRVADREWIIEIIPDMNYLNLKSNNYWLILILCLAISSGITYHVINHFRSENLLLNILPVKVAQELKEKGKTEARNFDMVSILFTDFADFTKTSANLSAHELVSEINICFSAFDEIVEKYGLEKIKTIGDAYMAVGGLPVQTKDSVKNTVLAALDMQEFMRVRKISNTSLGKVAFKMRAGIHTGEVTAGIVGSKKFQYDIWGDTVNTASRMESRGKVCHVNISQTTYELLKDDPNFTFDYRGKLEAKGKGTVDMWIVSSISTNEKITNKISLKKRIKSACKQGDLFLT